MTIVKSIDSIVEWLSENVCSQIAFKLPQDDCNDEGCDVRYVNPASFPLYVPGKEKLPPSVEAPVPSVCVQLMEGQDDLLEKTRQLQIRLCLACWNPGRHENEVFCPRKKSNAPLGYSYYRSEDVKQMYIRSMDGWKDVFNFVDLTLQKLESAEYIAGHRLVKESGIRYGVFTEEGTVWDYYPYWHSWIGFTLEVGTTPKTPQIYKNLL